MQLIAAGFEQLLVPAGMAPAKIVGGGISIPGPFEYATGVSA